VAQLRAEIARLLQVVEQKDAALQKAADDKAALEKQAAERGTQALNYKKQYDDLK
jgi:hypothetical protein